MSPERNKKVKMPGNQDQLPPLGSPLCPGLTLHACKKSHENIMAVANMVSNLSSEGRDLIVNKPRR